jgi:hypothetical protein
MTTIHYADQTGPLCATACGRAVATPANSTPDRTAVGCKACAKWVAAQEAVRGASLYCDHEVDHEFCDRDAHLAARETGAECPLRVCLNCGRKFAEPA